MIRKVSRSLSIVLKMLPRLPHPQPVAGLWNAGESHCTCNTRRIARVDLFTSTFGPVSRIMESFIFDRPPCLRLQSGQSRPHKRTLHEEWMFSHASLVPDSLRGVNTFFVLTCYTSCGTDGTTMQKQETEGLHIRVSPKMAEKLRQSVAKCTLARAIMPATS